MKQEVYKTGKDIRIKTAKLKCHSNSVGMMTGVQPSSGMFYIKYIL
jgi:hypothetical protein